MGTTATADELRNLQRIAELTTYNLVSLRTQCLDDERVKAEIRTLEAKLDKLLLRQVQLKGSPDTPLWLRRLDLERLEQVRYS